MFRLDDSPGQGPPAQSQVDRSRTIARIRPPCARQFSGSGAHPGRQRRSSAPGVGRERGRICRSTLLIFRAERRRPTDRTTGHPAPVGRRTVQTAVACVTAEQTGCSGSARPDARARSCQRSSTCSGIDGPGGTTADPGRPDDSTPGVESPPCVSRGDGLWPVPSGMFPDGLRTAEYSAVSATCACDAAAGRRRPPESPSLDGEGGAYGIVPRASSDPDRLPLPASAAGPCRSPGTRDWRGSRYGCEHC